MNKRKYDTFLGLFSLFFLTAIGPCEDQGTRFSFDEAWAGAEDPQFLSQYEELLQKYVDGNNRVKYSAWLRSEEDLATLRSVAQFMAQVDESSLNPDQRKAFYINAYNALTLDLILSHYDETLGGRHSPYPGVRSIRNIQNLDTRVWDRFTWRVAGRMRSLNDIEHRILRPMGDARIHLAIVCASKGCPPLYPHAFSSSLLNNTLNELAIAFVNSGRNTTISQENKLIRTSHILDWFKQDFVRSFGSLHNFFAQFVRGIDPSNLADYRIVFDDYDWSLNEAEDTPPGGSGTEKGISR